MGDFRCGCQAFVKLVLWGHLGLMSYKTKQNKTFRGSLLAGVGCDGDHHYISQSIIPGFGGHWPGLKAVMELLGEAIPRSSKVTW